MGRLAQKQPPTTLPEHSFSSNLHPPTLEEIAWMQKTSKKQFPKTRRKTFLSDELTTQAYNQLPASHSVIRNGTKLLGYHRIFPSSYEQMTRFLNHEINQEELIKEILDNQETFPQNTNIYLCESFIKEQYQLLGLATNSAKHALEQTKAPKHAPLYTWPTSQASRQAANKLAQETGRKIYFKESLY